MAVPVSSLSSAVPMPRTRLIGRDVEHALGLSFLLDEAVPLLTLSGPGGVGKTRLALGIAAAAAGGFADGAIFVDLAPVADPTMLPSVISHALGITESEGVTGEERLTAFLRPRQLLLVLDNCEHLVVAAAALVSSLLANCPALQILATGRTALRIRGEREFPVAPLALPVATGTPIVPDAPGPAMTLFVERAQAADPRFVLTEATASDVAEICRRLDGLPLAIELAAAWSKVLPPTILLHRLTARQLELSGGPRDLPARHQSLRETIAWSYDLLPTDAQRLLRHLAVFAGGCDLAAIDAILPKASEGSWEVLSDIATLLDHSLLERVQRYSTGEPRFRLLETIRLFAHERLVENGEEASARTAHASYFLTVAENANANLRGPEQVRWLDALEADHDNLRAALGWCLAGQHGDAALRLGAALARFWRRRGHIVEGLSWLERALQLDVPTVSAERAEALEAASNLARQRGLLQRAEAMVLEAESIRRTLGDQRGIARSLEYRAGICLDSGDNDHARVLLEEALALYRTLGKSWEVAKDLGFLGHLAREQGRLDDAVALLEESLAYFQDIGDLASMAQVLEDRGRLATDRFDAATATAFVNEALALYRTIGDDISIGRALIELSWLSGRQGDLDRAEALLTEAASLFHRTGAQSSVADTRGLLGWLAWNRGDFAAAHQFFEEWLVLCETHGNAPGIASAHGSLGSSYRGLGELKQAEVEILKSLTLWKEIGNSLGVAQEMISLGQVACDRGDLQPALAFTLEALSTLAATNEQEGLIEALESLATISAADGQAERAARLLGATHALRIDIGLVTPPAERAALERTTSLIREYLDAESLATAMAAGKTIPLETTIAKALALMPAGDRAPLLDVETRAPLAAKRATPSSGQRFGITEREQAVLQLLCQRLTNKEIAEQLFIGARTVQTHTISIFTKLGVDNRRDAAAFAARHSLA